MSPKYGGAVACRILRHRQKAIAKCAKVTTDPCALEVGLVCRLGEVGVLIAKGHVLIYKVTNGLHSTPTWGEVTEQSPRIAHEKIRFAIAVPSKYCSVSGGRSATDTSAAS